MMQGTKFPQVKRRGNDYSPPGVGVGGREGKTGERENERRPIFISSQD